MPSFFKCFDVTYKILNSNYINIEKYLISSFFLQKKYCGEMYIKFTIVTILSVQFNDNKHTHTIVTLPPPSSHRTLFIS